MNKTRESWLLEATDRLRVGLFAPIGETLPEVKVSVGFPGGRNPRKAIGQHWHPKHTKDGVSQVFISPVIDDAISALDTLIHELIHALYPDAGHKGDFARVARSVGLTGPMTATQAGPELKTRLEKLSSYLGAYPHAGVDLGARKKQSTRLIRLYCLNCDYAIWTTQRWLSQVGAPKCPTHDFEMGNTQKQAG